MKSVVICGSRRFKPGIRSLEADLKGLGVVVHSPHLHEGGEEWSDLSEEYKDFVLLGLTFDHFQKIRQADVVFVFNPDGYIGVNTTMEISFAVALGKPIYALCEDRVERGRNVLFRPDHPQTAAELLPFLC